MKAVVVVVIIIIIVVVVVVVVYANSHGVERCANGGEGRDHFDAH